MLEKVAFVCVYPYLLVRKISFRDDSFFAGKAIADLLRREVVPAIGCTEPMAVALCTVRARELLGGLPERIEVLLSANILKNAMGVGIPGTG